MMTNGGDGWCILCTSAGRTLPLVAALETAGIAAWSPRRTVKRPAPRMARRYVMGQRRPMIEVTLPILPGFVFARADQLSAIAAASLAPCGPLAGFSILQVGQRVPIVAERAIAGLRMAEAEAVAAIDAAREAESREVARRARAEMLSSERARRKALRQETKALARGDAVEVDDMPALAGMVGTVIEGRGTSARIHFGGFLTVTVEAWQVRPSDVQSGNTLHRDAA